MGGRVLIIVSYNGGNRHQSAYNAYQFLDLQYRQLTSLKHNLDEIVVIVNEAPGPDKEYERALKQFPVVLYRGNRQGSYGAWRDAYLLNPGYEWYFFIEDDYTFFTDDFDQKWIDLWKPEFTYIATLANHQFGYPLHAAISNGLTRGDILDKVDWSTMTATYQYDAMLQLGWSFLFDPSGLSDIHETYSVPFWANGSILQFGDERLPILIGPMQLLKPEPIDREIMLDRHKQRVNEDYDYKVRTE